MTGAKAGDHVEVWFTAVKGGLAGGLVASPHFTYKVESNTGAKVLVIADEDYTGVNPDYPPGTNAPKYAAQYRAALTAAGYTSDLWDVDKQGVPHDLGVLSHYKAVVWYYGDNRLTQDPEDELTDTPFGPLPDISVAEKEQYLTMSVRDYLNEGGKLVRAGETAGYEGLPGISDAVGGLYYGLNGDPSAECHVDSLAGFFSDCLILADDFRQYYEGAYNRFDTVDPAGGDGHRRADQRLPRRDRRAGGDGRQPARRGRRVRADERRAAGVAVPAVRQQGRGGVLARGQQPVRAGRGHALRGRAARGQLVHAPVQDGDRAGGGDGEAAVQAVGERRAGL